MNMNSCSHCDGCNDRCLTRSEIWAIVKEMTNKRKHDLNVTNIDAHMFDNRFDDHFQYIRSNLSNTSVITDKCCKRKLCVHKNRLLRVLNIKNTLDEEYISVVSSRYINQKW